SCSRAAIERTKSSPSAVMAHGSAIAARNALEWCFEFTVLSGAGAAAPGALFDFSTITASTKPDDLAPTIFRERVSPSQHLRPFRTRGNLPAADSLARLSTK